MGALGGRVVSFREGSVRGRVSWQGGDCWRGEFETGGLMRWLVSVFMCSEVSVCIILRFV